MTLAIQKPDHHLAELSARQELLQEVYHDSPVEYCADVLGVTLTSQQESIALALLKPPHKVLVRAGHSTGKSLVAACLISWWYDCHNPGICLSTAPSEKQVVRILWKELRGLRSRLGCFAGPAAPVLQLPNEPHHFAAGTVARSSEGFQGQHGAAVFIVLDEAVGVDPPFWVSAETMLGGDDYAMLAIFNPTDPASYAYQAEMMGGWSVHEMSATDHPNIAAGLRGEPLPVPNAIRLDRLTTMLEQWSTPVEGVPEPNDIEWPPGSGRWLRPGPEAEARLLGRWPTQSVSSVWSEVAWQRCLLAGSEIGPLVIGGDVARFGDDSTVAYVRKGSVVLERQQRTKQDTIETATLLRDLADKWGVHYNLNPKEVLVNTDDASCGGGVTDQGVKWGYRFAGRLGQHRANNQRLYPNRRSEGWFDVADLARGCGVSVARLPREAQTILRTQLMGVKYAINKFGQRVVEEKAITKQRLKQSPDDADAFMLCFADHPVESFRVISPDRSPAPLPSEPMGPRRSLVRWFKPTQTYQARPEYQGEIMNLPDFKTEPEAAHSLMVFCQLLAIPEMGDRVELDSELQSSVEARIQTYLRSRRLIP